VLVKQQLN